MPSYNFNPIPYKPNIKVLYANKEEYLFGSWQHSTGPTIGTVITDAVNGSNIATVVFKITEGNVPIKGALITILGAQNTAFAGSAVLQVALSSVSVVMLTGVCTVTFPLTAALQAATNDFGKVIIPQPEIPESLANGASIPVDSTYQTAQTDQGRTITAVVKFPTLPWAATVTLQGAIDDYDSEYADIGTVAVVTAGVLTGGQLVIQIAGDRFYRFNVSGLNESSPALLGTILAKLIG